MATCYYLINHTKQEYLDLGKRFARDGKSWLFGGYGNPDITDAQIVEYLLESRGDDLRLVSDVEADLSFTDTYTATPVPPAAGASAEAGV